MQVIHSGGRLILYFDLTEQKKKYELCNGTTHLSAESAKNIVRGSKNPNSFFVPTSIAHAASLQEPNCNLISRTFYV